MGIPDIVGNILDIGAARKAIRNAFSAEPELSIVTCRLSMMPPYRLAFTDAISPETYFRDTIGGSAYDQRRILKGTIGHVGACRIIISVLNNSERMASIRAIILNKQRLTINNATWSLLFTPEGGTGGNPRRFYCNLDDDPQRFLECFPERGRYRPVGSVDYFESGRIEIEPAHQADIVLLLAAKSSAYRCTIQLRAESRKLGVYVIEPKEQPDIVVLPFKGISEDKRYRYNFALRPPQYSPESGEYEITF